MPQGKPSSLYYLMMGKYLSRLVGGLLTLSILLFGGNFVHVTLSHSMAAMPSGQCQSNCSFSQAPADISTKPGDILRDKDIEPRPAEPYYLAFMGVGWTMVITVAALYLSRYLRWRPPDLYKLNATYRF